MKHLRFSSWLLVFLLARDLAPAGQADAEPVLPGVPRPYPARMQWWGEARFGLFIHWGPVSLKGTEIGWSRGGDRRGYGSKGTEIPVDVYDNLYRQFNPTNFNAREWVAVAQAAGMRYLVFTSRHHDGFSMFDTQASDYRITSADSPFRRDVVRELADACHAAGLRFGLYYSPPDWHHPDAFTPDRHDRYLAYLSQQITELSSQYGQLDILWFDGLGKTAAEYGGANLVKILRTRQPNIIINDRVGLPEDHDTPEQRIGKYQDHRPWESCITICNQWAWKPNDDMKSLPDCLRTLVLCAGGDGNLLFNVGPMPDGRIEPRQVQRLREMGAWLNQYGESIYATRGGPWKPTRTLASTRKGHAIYLHLFRVDNGRVELPALPCPVKSAARLGGGKVEFRTEADKLVLTLDPTSLDPVDTVVRLELDRSAMEIPAIAITAPSSVKASASNVFQQMLDEYGPQAAFDADADTRWATDGGTKQAWIAADLGKPQTIRRVRLDEAIEKRVQQFEFQCREGGVWKTVFAGKTIGSAFEKELEPVTAQEFRLNILDATDGPTFNEIELLAK